MKHAFRSVRTTPKSLTRPKSTRGKSWSTTKPTRTSSSMISSLPTPRNPCSRSNKSPASKTRPTRSSTPLGSTSNYRQTSSRHQRRNSGRRGRWRIPCSSGGCWSWWWSYRSGPTSGPRWRGDCNPGTDQATTFDISTLKNKSVRHIEFLGWHNKSQR